MFTRKFENDENGIQVMDMLFCGKKFRVVVSFDEYYSKYGSERWNENKITEILEPNGDRILVKHLFTLPFKIKYKLNNTNQIVYKIKPDVFVIIKKPKKIKIDIEIIKNICKYAEDKAIYDKLSSYGDFYYKIKKLLK